MKVDSGSLAHVDRNTYSVHSRLIGEQVEACIQAEWIEICYDGRKVEELPRLRGRGEHRIDYRHIIDWLVRKLVHVAAESISIEQRVYKGVMDTP